MLIWKREKIRHEHKMFCILVIKIKLFLEKKEKNKVFTKIKAISLSSAMFAHIFTHPLTNSIIIIS